MSPDDAAALLHALPLPLVLIGANERIVATNEAANGLFNRVAMVGGHYTMVLRQPAVLTCVETALRRGEIAEAELSTRDAARDLVYRVRAAPLAAGAVQGALLSFTDISDLQDATQIRRDFVANVSHELRSPLTALLGFIETLKGPAKEDPVAHDRFLAIMEKEASRMSRLIQDLLSLSRVEANARVRPTDPVDLSSLLTSSTMTLGPLAADRGVTLDVQGADGSVIVPGDADQLLQVFTNLAENAIKYGGSEVKIVLHPVARDPALRRDAVLVEVIDNGDGIDAYHIPRLTERFYRVDNHRSREMGGTGLGLAIVKHIVNRHRGRLRILSTPGERTCLQVSLPVT